jgi:septum formation protein
VTQTERRVVILASGSPRRRELLSLVGLPFELAQVDVDETPFPGEPAAVYTARLSQEKAQAALKSSAGRALILAADTTVVDGGTILGKPGSAAEARAMLRQLRGHVHQVYTALTLIDAATRRSVTEVAVTSVPMRSYTDDEIDAYIASGDPFDKAGSYAIQNTSFRPVASLRGCYANVMGLPLCHLLRALRAFGVMPQADVPLLCQHRHHYDCDVTEDILAGRV